jgi:hypothetical protein
LVRFAQFSYLGVKAASLCLSRRGMLRYSQWIGARLGREKSKNLVFGKVFKISFKMLKSIDKILVFSEIDSARHPNMAKIPDFSGEMGRIAGQKSRFLRDSRKENEQFRQKR